MHGLVFVPLSGLASVNYSYQMIRWGDLVIVFVPLSGLASVNYTLYFIINTIFKGFRPLIGVSFCKLYISS